MSAPILTRTEVETHGVPGSPCWSFTDGDHRLLVMRGWQLRGFLGRTDLTVRAQTEWWYVVTEDGGLVGHGIDGYQSLREVREHVRAVQHDQANGVDVRWTR